MIQSSEAGLIADQVRLRCKLVKTPYINCPLSVPKFPLPFFLSKKPLNRLLSFQKLLSRSSQARNHYNKMPSLKKLLASAVLFAAAYGAVVHQAEEAEGLYFPGHTFALLSARAC